MVHPSAGHSTHKIGKGNFTTYNVTGKGDDIFPCDYSWLQGAGHYGGRDGQGRVGAIWRFMGDSFRITLDNFM